MDTAPYLAALRAYVEARDFAGYDPYDALTSPLVRGLTLGTKAGRLAWTQFLRRCPLNLRPLLGVHSAHNPKAIGLFLGGYARLAHRGDATAADHVERLLALTAALRSAGCRGHAWGYNFDWQSRVAFVPRGTPTIVNTAFIGHALLDCHALTGRSVALELAARTPNFLLNDLHRLADGDAFCFSYTPLDHNYVHNANLLGASLLARLAAATGDRRLLDPAHAALAYSLKHQHDDGSWYYAEAPQQRWIDSFHTGFNLEALRWLLASAPAPALRAAYDHGVRFYAEHFFRSDGAPKYYHNRLYPVDIHAPAEAISFFAGEGTAHRDLVERVLGWTLAQMHDPRGYFWFRRGRWLVNRIPYMRWSQAWMFRALTEYAWQQAGAPVALPGQPPVEARPHG